MFNNIYKNKKVLVTGHTGFKGSWLTMWLISLGAKVSGFSDKIPTNPSHFEELELDEKINHFIGDVRNYNQFKKICDSEKPEIVFHLAAQPLVRESYNSPLETIETNIIGTANILEISRNTNYIKSLVIITSDKCYDNVEWLWGYRENDKLGGEDPYSASKGAAEIVVKTYMKSFFNNDDIFVCSARAGNVIGGGDWAADRIVPDSMIAWSNNKIVTIRSPYATRPWQHVLEPLSGYLQLGAELFSKNNICKNQSYNLGPDSDVNKTVQELLNEIKKNWKSANWKIELSKNSIMKEASLLKLSCDKINNHIDWFTTLNFSQTIEFTVDWYKQFYSKERTISTSELTLSQIKDYSKIAKEKKLKWAIS